MNNVTRTKLLIVLLALATIVTAIAQAADTDPTVYVTKTGAKYHSAGCQYLKQSSIPIKLSAAKAKGYTACSKCGPPQ